MIDLGLNQYKIKEIKYEVKEGKTIIFKLRNFNLEDVEIEEEKNCCDKSCTCNKSSEKKKYEIDSLPLNKSKNLIDKIKDIPYTAIEKIGTLNIYPKVENGKVKKGENTIEFYPEPDPYVVNDEREMPKQKRIISSDDEKNENVE